jgi:alpha-ketoglutarate-dependent taurine dioxygenase
LSSTRAPNRARHLETRPVSPALGTEFLNLDLREELPDEVVAAVRTDFYETGLVLLRGQHHLTYAEQERFASHIGPPTSRFPSGFIGAVPSTPEQYISNTRPEGYGREGRLLKHSDYCFDEQLILGICLFGEVPPRIGGATIFVNARKGAQQLPNSLRRRLESAHVRHVYDFDGVEEGHTRYDIDGKLHVTSLVRPALMKHPVTGEEILYVNELMTDRIAGLSAGESHALLQEVFGHLNDPSLRYDHTWAEGDVILFDNIMLQHGRTEMPEGQPRSLRRLQFDLPPVAPAN